MSKFVAVFFMMAALWAQAPLKSGTTENLRGISVVSAKVAWASGTHGTYLRTRDGGNSWHVAQVPGAEGLDFRDVEAFGSDTAYLLAAGPGDQSRIYKTTDGGAHWKLQFTNMNPKGFFDCMAFWDREHGIAVGDPVADGAGKLRFEVMVTADGGAHWDASATNAMPEAVAGEGAFAASGTCVAVQGKKNVWFVTGGKVARVFRSGDRGKNWTVAETPIEHGQASAGIFSVAFRDAKHGVIAGGDYKDPAKGGKNLAFSDDGGKTWTLSGVAPQAYFSAVAYDKRFHRLLATGTALTIEVKDNKALKLSEQNLNAIGVSRGGKAIGVGPKGLVVDLTATKARATK
jgi:photosystem II stability/assembly factor-like uncharacterized protein